MTAVEWLFEQVVNRTERVYFLKELEQAKEMEKEEKLKVQIEENESVLQMLRLHGNDSSVMRVFLRLESLKQTYKSE